MAVSSVALLSYNSSVTEHFQTSYASVINVMDGLSEDGDMSLELGGEQLINTKDAPEIVFVQTDDRAVNLEILEGSGYAKPGEKGVKMMRLSFDSGEEVTLQKLKFKISGSGISAGYLYDGEQQISTGRLQNEQINFSGWSMPTKDLWLVLDLEETVMPGERIRLDIESAEDISPKVAGYYPIKGKYLSVVGK